MNIEDSFRYDVADLAVREGITEDEAKRRLLQLSEARRLGRPKPGSIVGTDYAKLLRERYGAWKP